MATYHIVSAKEKAIASSIDAAIDDGRKVRPPSGGVPVNECADCHGYTTLTQQTRWGRLCESCKHTRESHTEES